MSDEIAVKLILAVDAFLRCENDPPEKFHIISARSANSGDRGLTWMPLNVKDEIFCSMNQKHFTIFSRFKNIF